MHEVAATAEELDYPLALVAAKRVLQANVTLLDGRLHDGSLKLTA